MVKKPLPTIGVSDYTIFPVITDDSGLSKFGSPVRLPGTVQISPTDSAGHDTFDADNGAYEAEAYLENIGHTLTNADIPPAIDAMMRGLTMKNGVLDVGVVASPPRFGTAWRVLKSDGSYRYVMYYNGIYAFKSNIGGKTKPSTGASEKQTAQAEFKALERDADGMYYRYEDSTGLTDKEIALLDEQYLGTAFPVGFGAITAANSKVTESMGVYTWTGADTLNAVCIADSGVVTISFDMLMRSESGKYSRFNIQNAAGEDIIRYKCEEYGGERDNYEIMVGDFSSTDATIVRQGTTTGTSVTDYTHFECVINLNAGTASLVIGGIAEHTGAITANGVSGLSIYSNHAFDGRRISVKNLKFEVAEG